MGVSRDRAYDNIRFNQNPRENVLYILKAQFINASTLTKQSELHDPEKNCTSKASLSVLKKVKIYK